MSNCTKVPHWPAHRSIYRIIVSWIAGVIGLLLISACATEPQQPADSPPNILLILADDLGYGDIGVYNPESEIPTPNIDRLAAEGIRFTDAHSPSTVCTPTRYSVMTGRMAFRTGMRGVFAGVQGPSLINDSLLTLPEMLREKGYNTALTGKWHIGMTFLTEDGSPVYEAEITEEMVSTWRNKGNARVNLVDFSKPIPDGPLSHGFDEFFGTVACPTTDWLYAWIEGDKIPVPPTGILDKSPLPKHPYADDNRQGMVAPNFDLEEVDMVFLEKSKTFLKNHVAKSPDKPFFLFHSTQAVHSPSFPGDAFKGRTDSGPHGDFIFELDYVVGELMKTLEELDVADNTLVIFTSDNGPEVWSVYHMRTDHNHDGARPWRGVKRDQWEGGHRVPMIARWPARIKAGDTTNQIFNLTDIMATAAAIVDYKLPADVAEDSFDFLPVLTGKATSPVREYILHQTISLNLAIRKGSWKYLDHKGSGGNRYQGKYLQEYILPEKAPDAPGQLYNLETDPGETTNLYFEHPEIVEELKSKLDELVAGERQARSDEPANP